MCCSGQRYRPRYESGGPPSRYSKRTSRASAIRHRGIGPARQLQRFFLRAWERAEGWPAALGRRKGPPSPWSKHQAPGLASLPPSSHRSRERQGREHTACRTPLHHHHHHHRRRRPEIVLM
nr:unnamed protein product [Digitaria exilis]